MDEKLPEVLCVIFSGLQVKYKNSTYIIMQKPDFVAKENWVSTQESGTHKQIIAVTGKNDRFGSQYSAQMSGLAYARYHALTFRFTEFHGDKDSAMATSFCGMKSDCDDDTNRDPDIVFKRHCNVSQSRDIRLYFPDHVIAEIRDMYYGGHDKSDIEIVTCDVALHIRRGDVGCTDSRIKNSDGTDYMHWKERFDDNAYYKKAIQFIRETHGEKLQFVIFSQGRNSEFEELLDENVKTHLNGDWRQAFHSMVSAPILVTSISEFAWTSGLLSKGTVYANKRMFRSPLSSWLHFDF